MEKATRRTLFLDELRLWSFTTNIIDKKNLRSFMFGYFWIDDIIEKYFALDSTNRQRTLRLQPLTKKLLHEAL